MPWRGPEYEGEFPSLGWGLLDWYAEFLTVPDGPLAGQPLVFTDEQTGLLVRWYQLDDRGRFVYRRGCKRAAQGWGKSPFLGAIALGELAGPCRFDGWDADGEPVGVPMVAPWVQIAAVSEDQTDNTYAAAYGMAAESELAGSLIDIGLTRMYLVGQTGRLEPVTASAGSRLGQRITFAVLDETHLWTKRNGGHKLAATVRRNAGKMAGRTFESTNAHLVGEDSVAERSQVAGIKGAPGLLYDAVEAPHVEDLSDKVAVREALAVAYGDSAAWVDLDRLALEVADPGTDPDDARRFYLNQPTSGAFRPVDVKAWERLAAPDRVVGDGERIGLGFDGSISGDSTVLYGCTADGFVFELGAWERPAGAIRGEWVVPRGEVHDLVMEVFTRFSVGRMLCDPPTWRTEIDEWAAKWNPERVEDAIVVALDTNQARRFAPACDRFATAVREGINISHDGKRGLTENLAACVKKPVRVGDDPDDNRSQFVVVKADTRKIDRAVGAILAYEAAATMPAEPASLEPLSAWV